MLSDVGLLMHFVLFAVVFLAALAVFSLEGEKVDVSRFGRGWMLPSETERPVYCAHLVDGKTDESREYPAGACLQVDWEEPRDVRSVVLKGAKLPEAGKVRVQYWYRIWPDNGGGGWMRLDDPFNGEWVDTFVDALPEGDSLTLKFKPLSLEENSKAERHGFDFRRTYKIRVVLEEAASVSALEAYTQAIWKTASVKLHWKPLQGGQPFKGTIEAKMAQIISVNPTADGIVADVAYSHDDERLSEDRGYVIFRTGDWDTFSVYVDDVVRERQLYVRDIDAHVSLAGLCLSFADWKKPEWAWDATVVEKVGQMPEQTLQRVSTTMAAKPTREMHLCVANMRQEFTLTAQCNIDLLANSLRIAGPDADRTPWRNERLFLKYAFSTHEKPILTDKGDREIERCLEAGYLPVVHASWDTDGIAFQQSSLATMLMTGIADDEENRRGDEPVVLLQKWVAKNTTQKPASAYLWTEFSKKVPMQVEDGLIRLETASDGKTCEGLTPVRGWLDTRGKGILEVIPDCVPAIPGTEDQDLQDPAAPRPALRYRVELAPGEEHTFYFNVTYIELLDSGELAALKAKNYDDCHDEVVNYWNAWLGRGAQYEVPEPELNNFYKANLWHVIGSTDKDPETGLYHQGAATVRYANFANETAMVSQSLEMRGEHEEAIRLLEPFLACQGVKILPGNFRSKEGLMYAAHPDPENDPYTAQGYNMHHGWALWKIAEHFKYTRDADWLKSVSDKLIAACDWITSERQSTKFTHPDGSRPVEWGLLPAGDLEDVAEYLYFYSTNAYSYIGLAVAADVLGQIGHPEADRLRKDAQDYAVDIMASVREAVANCPVVALKDGTWIPFVPPRSHVHTHRKEGWIREGLYSSIHLLEGELLKPLDLMVDWILQELEDNIFLSAESGYNVADMESAFFDYGGFNLQPCLCPNATAHLRRDEIPQFIRVFWNTFWASYYPDTVCFAEWVKYFGMGGGPLYKTPDECKFVQFMRNMLVYEEGDELRIGMAVPREWMTDGKRVLHKGGSTFFGKIDLEITSRVSEGKMVAYLNLPSRNPAASAVLRFRHPESKPIARVTINGDEHKDFDAARELITLPTSSGAMEVVAYFL